MRQIAFAKIALVIHLCGLEASDCSHMCDDRNGMAKCWACGSQRLIYRDELHDWRIPRSAHRSVPYGTSPAW